MSDDIVEWLIDFSEATNNPRCADAADKIIGISSANRRLRAENEKLEQQVAEFVNRFTEDMFVLRAENETLRRDVRTAVMGDSAELQDVKRENEKLRAALKPFADAVKDECNWKYDINVDDFRAAAAALKDTDNGSV